MIKLIVGTKGSAAVGVCQNGAFHGLAVDNAHVLVCQEVQAVKVAFQRVDEQVLCRLLHIHDGLEHGAGAFLNELAHGVQVGGEDAACGEQALVVLALALAEQLLIPLVHQGEVGLVALQDLNSLALAVQDVWMSKSLRRICSSKSWRATSTA